MPTKILSKRILLLIILVGFTLSPLILFYLIPKMSNLYANNQIKNNSNPPLENSAANLAQEQKFLPVDEASVGQPVRLKIPVINVDALVEYVGLTPDGAMDIPKNTDNTAWFELGARPGNNGSAVIAGHFGRKKGKASVFDNLHKLRQGDKLYIEDDNGLIISFVVRENRSYDPKADVANVFGSIDGKAHLNLITCEGIFDKVSKSYPQRLVVFADKE